ncbi:MAG TPA: hypothetical protein VG275_12100 [Solirubrobacteraceae bacterium]|nr:hypothetical protein [Solirubrobacteraceae bacterium]
MTNHRQAGRRGALALVPEIREDDGPRVWFCGHCGERPAAGGPPAGNSRVCESCGMGLLLETVAHAAPHDGDAFLVLDRSLSVCAVSRGAETLLATTETAAVNRHVTELLVPADSESGSGASLAEAVSAATRGGEEARTVFVRPANLFGVRMRARIVHCGPPHAALVAFDDPGR